MKVHHLSYTTARGHVLGISLHGAHLPSNSPTVVYLHGFKGFKDWGFVPYIGERFAGAGLRLLAMNFSHNGVGSHPGSTDFTELEKFRDNTFSLELEEALEVIGRYHGGHLLDGAPGVPMGLLGHSRGGGIALLASGHPAITAVCTWAAVSTFARYPSHVIEAWRQQGYLEVTNARTGQVMHLGYQLHEDLVAHIDGKLSVERVVRANSKPLCIIHGEADEAVPTADARAIFEWSVLAQAELHLLPRAGHTFGAKHPFEGSNPILEELLAHTLHFYSHHLTLHA